jgi:hypothetical protein
LTVLADIQDEKDDLDLTKIRRIARDKPGRSRVGEGYFFAADKGETRRRGLFGCDLKKRYDRPWIVDVRVGNVKK